MNGPSPRLAAAILSCWVMIGSGIATPHVEQNLAVPLFG
jgi:hypothetical protein